MRLCSNVPCATCGVRIFNRLNRGGIFNRLIDLPALRQVAGMVISIREVGEGKAVINEQLSVSSEEAL